MRSNLKLFLVSVMASCLFAVQAPRCSAQDQKVEKRASSGISVTNRNGDVTVTWKGKVVFTGKATGRVSGKSSNENGVEFAAAFDANRLLWENVPGAGAKLNDR